MRQPTRRPRRPAPVPGGRWRRSSWLLPRQASHWALAVLIGGAVLWTGAGPVRAADSAAPSLTWQAPLLTIRVLRAAELPEDLAQAPWQSAHRGADLLAAVGDPVFAAGSGVVVFAGTLAGRGVVSIEHTGGLRTTYEPVDALVVAGEAVARGEVIATVQAGGTHCAMTCLHWGARRGEVYIDPLRLLTTGRVRLLPHLGRHAPLPSLDPGHIDRSARTSDGSPIDEAATPGAPTSTDRTPFDTGVGAAHRSTSASPANGVVAVPAALAAAGAWLHVRRRSVTAATP